MILGPTCPGAKCGSEKEGGDSQHVIFFLSLFCSGKDQILAEELAFQLGEEKYHAAGSKYTGKGLNDEGTLTS
jgi:hypothetical protein